ncbi:FtsB family cell division protein [Corynebacterium nuruki]|uniref:Septum formation initiator family protein n=1 Tax=Corynebacterium nuruki TaxID=1032851 RepID=A0A3D4T0H6_9CORY|nr:septum formation initiator family protein [Corynebacterium nuruki]HCT15029.1 septum formation initiator family protein [Corynebacterium nuruki]
MGTKDEESQQAPAGLPEPRSRENRTRRARAAKAAPKRLARSFVELPKKANPLVALTVIVVVTVMALTVAQPLRNYFQQKADLAQVNAKIDDQIQQRQDLSDELNRYRDENYVKEQARVRLGVVEPGETAYRLTDPKIDAGATGAPGAGEAPEDRGDGDKDNPWYTRLWGSVSTPDHTVPDKNKDEGDDGDGKPTSENLPIDPNQPAPEPAPEQE